MSGMIKACVAVEIDGRSAKITAGVVGADQYLNVDDLARTAFAALSPEPVVGTLESTNDESVISLILKTEGTEDVARLADEVERLGRAFESCQGESCSTNVGDPAGSSANRGE